MIIKNLELKNYRNYDELNISFNKKLNIIIGDNAQGKTNILEAIYVLAVTKSYLGVSDKNLIKIGNKFSLIKAVIDKEDSLKNLEIIINDNGKKIKINNKEIKKLSDYVSNFRVILFSPDNIRMIKEGPGIRRRFLNVELSQLSNKYVKLVNDFNGLLKQRNEFIRIMNLSSNSDLSYLDVIDNKFAQLAVDIYGYRKKFIDQVNEQISKIYEKIAGFSDLVIKYHSNIDYDEDKKVMINNLYDKLKKSFDKDKNYGMTFIGPHRDDFYFYLGGKNISLYGSQGQLRMAILALKISEIDIFTKYSGESPILLLDDIFSELDVTKKNKLIDYILNDVQTIITTTDINLIDTKLVENANVYVINDGKIITQEKLVIRKDK